VEFGNKLETVGGFAFSCTSLRSITTPSVRIVEQRAFSDCEQLTDVELPAVETIEAGAFAGCENLHRIAIPLKDNMFPLASYLQRCTHFGHCENLRTIDLVGLREYTKPSPLSSWRVGEMKYYRKLIASIEYFQTLVHRERLEQYSDGLGRSSAELNTTKLNITNY
jgi:hypothetical protein